MKRHFLFFLLTTLFSFSIQAQTIDTLSFLQQSPTFHPKRTLAISTIGAVAYTTTMVSVGKLWYSQFEKAPFHFFNDNLGWRQMDKVGHAWTSYTESIYAYQLYRWAGVEDNTAIWVGGLLGSTFQLGIEVLDGFSAEWGASVGDIMANATGSALFISQALLWKEQRIQLKFSAHKMNYQNYPMAIQQRAANLYGTKLSEQILKDYNGQTYWLSINLSTFLHKNNRFPKWLQVAIGYGAEDLFGAERNSWVNEEGVNIDFSHMPSYRQYYLSLDVDLTKIHTKSRLLNVLLGTFSTIKIPAPSLRIAKNKKTKFFPVYW